MAAFITATASLASGEAPGTRPEDYVCEGVYRSPRPLAVLDTRGRIIFGWEATVPSLVLYADGQVLYTRCEEHGKCSNFETRLTDQEFARFRSKLAPSPDFLALSGSYYLVRNVDDLPTSDLFLWTGSELRHVALWGDIDDIPAFLARFGVEHQGDARPVEFERYRKLMEEFQSSSSRSWKPKHLRVQIELAEHYVFDEEELARPPVKWPREWPTPMSPASSRVEDGVFDVYIPASDERRLNRLLDRVRIEHAFGVVFADRRWVFSHAEPVVPGACAWEPALDR